MLNLLVGIGCANPLLVTPEHGGAFLHSLVCDDLPSCEDVNLFAKGDVIWISHVDVAFRWNSCDRSIVAKDLAALLERIDEIVRLRWCEIENLVRFEIADCCRSETHVLS